MNIWVFVSSSACRKGNVSNKTVSPSSSRGVSMATGGSSGVLGKKGRKLSTEYFKGDDQETG